MQNRSQGLRFSSEQRVMGFLLVLVPLTLVSAQLSWAPALQFFLAVGSVIPLAAYIGAATEELTNRVGGRIGGLLNATFGNTPDLLVGFFGVQKGLIPLVKATLIGALISNSALIMGLCYIFAGLLYGSPRFNRQEAGHHAILMMLTLAAILFPSIGAIVMCGGTTCKVPVESDTVLHISVGIAIVLLLAYAAYIVFGVFGWVSLKGANEDGREVKAVRERGASEGTTWPVWFSVIVLAGATAALIPVTDILTSSVDPVTRVLHWTQVFVGIVIVANAGNVAEGYAALKLAIQRGGERRPGVDSGLDLALGIASASSIQIATFVASLVVLYSLFQHPMNLVFSPVEISIVGLLVIIFGYIVHDGETNWLEGAQLLALYAMAAIVFYALPVSVF